MKGDGMSKVTYRRKAGTPLTAKQRQQIENLKKKNGGDIDHSDAPSLPESVWAKAVRGGLYRPVKQPVSLRIDADVLEWLKKDGDGYQTRANRILRERMLQEIGEPHKSAA